MPNPLSADDGPDGQRHYVAPPPGESSGGNPRRFYGGDISFVVRRQVAVLQLHSLIATFQEVDEYDPGRRRNSPPPPLWISDEDYLKDIKALLAELRRLNDLIEANKIPDQEKVEKSGSIVAMMAEKACMSASDVVGKGLGAIILGSVALVLVELGAADVAKALASTIKGGK